MDDGTPIDDTLTGRLKRTREYATAELRWLAAEIPDTAGSKDAGGWELYALWIRALRDLAAAVADLDRVLAAHTATQPPAAPFDVEELKAELWNAIQIAGAPTKVSDAAVDVIRNATGGRA